MLQMNIMVKTIPQRNLTARSLISNCKKPFQRLFIVPRKQTGIAPNIYSSVDKGITDLARGRDLSEDFANELFKQAQQQPENVEVLLKNTITSNWAAKHFAGDIDEAKTFIDQRAEENFRITLRSIEAFKEAGIDLLIPRKNDKQAAQFWSGNLSEENFMD